MGVEVPLNSLLSLTPRPLMKKSMQSKFVSAFSLLFLCLTALGTVRADDAKVDEVIARARAYIGSEEALTSVKSLYKKANILYSDGNSGTAEITFMKPLFHKFIGVVNENKEISALDETEGWRKTEVVGQPEAWSLDLYDVGEILHLQANVREELGFFQRPTPRGATVEFVETRMVDDIECDILHYDYGDGIWFRRCFEVGTGKLILSINDKGVRFVPDGELEVDGIKFPAKVTTIFQSPYGVETLELSFSKIELNRNFKEESFKIPAF